MLKGNDMRAYETYMMGRVEEESKKSQMEREDVSGILFSEENKMLSVGETRLLIEKADEQRVANELLSNIRYGKQIDPVLAVAGTSCCTTDVPEKPSWDGRIGLKHGKPAKFTYSPRGKGTKVDSIGMEDLDFVQKFRYKYFNEKILPVIKQVYVSLRKPYVFKIVKQAQ